MDNFLLPVNEEVDGAVKDYAESIVGYIKQIHPEVEVVMEYNDAANEQETHKAKMADIQTEYGFVTIFPDFNKKTARAALLNRGLISAMELEGFNDEQINNSPVYSSLLPFSIENAEVLALILTNDFGLQHQKNL